MEEKKMTPGQIAFELLFMEKKRQELRNQVISDELLSMLEKVSIAIMYLRSLIRMSDECFATTVTLRYIDIWLDGFI